MNSNHPEYRYLPKSTKHSAESRQKCTNERAKKPVLDKITNERTFTEETVTFRYSNRHHTLIPLNRTNERIITFTFNDQTNDSTGNVTPDQTQAEHNHNIKDKESRKDFKHLALTIAAALVHAAQVLLEFCELIGF